MYTLKENDSRYIVNESYFYKTEPYYTIVENENEGIRTVPSSSDVLDAYIVPICLEKAKLAGIPVCEWVISYQYVSLPAVVYGLNYFSTPSDHFLVRGLDEARSVIKHVTNRGRYPFCYQKIGETSEVVECASIFGKTINCCRSLSSLAERIYEVFRIPLVNIVMIRDGDSFLLSSLAPVRYSQLSKDETELLQYLLNERVRGLE
ncbi:MAG: RimK-like ATPgrasp N-terminal domain-containing protein [Methanothrix sp.]|nr:RimK-like ATPgrasp N-terminal domain-containing protein [Methanothrix sp.]